MNTPLQSNLTQLKKMSSESLAELLTDILSRYNQDTSSSAVIEMTNQLDQLSSSKSVLYKKDAATLTNTDIFSYAFVDLEKACTLLALGDKIDNESKVATVATIYGMILHCRNIKVSCIQIPMPDQGLRE